jgi:hypothetical protein
MLKPFYKHSTKNMQTENTNSQSEHMQPENNNGYCEVTRGLSLIATILVLIAIPNALWLLANTVYKMFSEHFSVDRVLNLSMQTGLLVAACIMLFRVLPAMRKRIAQNAVNQ